MCCVVSEILTQETLTLALFSNSLEDDTMGLNSGGESD
jgi:hypothetical protein